MKNLYASSLSRARRTRPCRPRPAPAGSSVILSWLRQHPLGEPVHDQHLGRELLAVDDLGQQPDGVVHVGRVERPDPPPGNAAELHGELGIERQVHVGPLEVLDQPRQLVRHGAVPDLHVQEHQPPPLLGPAQHLLDQLVRVPQPILRRPSRGLPCATVAIRCSAGITLPARVCLGPFASPCARAWAASRSRRQLAQNPHALEFGIAVEGDDPGPGQQRAWERRGAFHGPARRVGGGEVVSPPLPGGRLPGRPVVLGG